MTDAELFRLCRLWARRVCRAFPPLIEDATSGALLEAHLARSRGHAAPTIAYAARIGALGVLRGHRGRRGERDPRRTQVSLTDFPVEDFGDGGIGDLIDGLAFETIVARAPTRRQRQALRAYYGDGRSDREVGAALGVSGAAAQQLRLRGLAAVRAHPETRRERPE